MATERVGDIESPHGGDRFCRHPEHEPAKHVVLPPGRYRHTCPKCGRVLYFTVDKGTL